MTSSLERLEAVAAVLLAERGNVPKGAAQVLARSLGTLAAMLSAEPVDDATPYVAWLLEAVLELE